MISALTGFVGECSIRLGAIVTRALSSRVAQCMTLMEAAEMADSSWRLHFPSSQRTPLPFVLGSAKSIKEAIHSHIIPPSTLKPSELMGKLYNSSFAQKYLKDVSFFRQCTFNPSEGEK